MFIVTKKWFIEMADYIKSIDSHHLVGIATVDVAWPEWDQSLHWDRLNTPQLDFIDLHYYEDLYCKDNTDFKARLTTILERAKKLNKPIILGELGYTNDIPRDKYLNIYQSVISISLHEGVSGVIPYSWGPLGPNNWGGRGGFCMYTNDQDICDLLKGLAP